MENERVVLKRKFADEHFLEIVLAIYMGKFVTWIYNRQDGGYYHGNYFNNIDDAEKNFDKRK